MTGKSCKVSLKHISVEKVQKLLSNLKNRRSTAVDELDNFCVKISSKLIAKPLHHIITLSIIQRIYPTSWKYAKVVPLHKKGCILNKQNYRPVAILSPLGKILDRIAYEQLYSHFSTNNLFLKTFMVTGRRDLHRQTCYKCKTGGSEQLMKAR